MWPFRRKPKQAGPKARFVVFQGGDGLWRWGLMLDATIVAETPKSRVHRRKTDCLREVEAAWSATGRTGVIEVEK